MSETFKSGFAAIVGRANAGKSTLLNRFIGEKISIVSPKPQTTRNKIAGVLNGDNYQIVFEDTPGVIKKTGKLADYMRRSIDLAGSETDIVIVVIDGTKGLSNEDVEIIEKYKTRGKHAFFLINKTDEAPAERVFPVLKKLGEMGLDNIYPISARTGQNVDKVLSAIIDVLEEGEMFYPEDMITDKSRKFMVAEIIREKALYLYQEEIPHGVGININKYTFDENRNIYDIDAEIYCEKKNHKAIIIGKKGSVLKQLGEKARLEIESLLENKVYLTLWVKVKENWRESEAMLKELGYNKKEI